MKKILIVCDSNPGSDPRPNRMVRWLKDSFAVWVMGKGDFSMPGVEFMELAEDLLVGKPRPGPKIKKLAGILSSRISGVSLKCPGSILERIKALGIDLVITHDCTLLPFAFAVKSVLPECKVMLDAREYYPKNFDDKWKWRVLVKPLLEAICSKYLGLCDKIITVCDGIAAEYAKVYGVNPEVIMSLPDYEELSPMPVHENKILIVHHGSANDSRKTDMMIEMMDYVDKRFAMDMYLVGEPSYLAKLKNMADRRKNVNVLPPLPMSSLVKKANSYDIGIYLAKPSNFNLEHALGNKFFEFIMSRLAVAVGPGVEMKKIIDKYNCGIISGDFTPESMARALNSMSASDIMKLKINSDIAAKELNAGVNQARALSIIEEIFSG